MNSLQWIFLLQICFSAVLEAEKPLRYPQMLALAVHQRSWSTCVQGCLKVARKSLHRESILSLNVLMQVHLPPLPCRENLLCAAVLTLA